jgi:hypothetical protein
MKAKSRRKRQPGNEVVSRFDEDMVFAQADWRKDIALVGTYFLAWQFARNWLGLGSM